MKTKLYVLLLAGLSSLFSKANANGVAIVNGSQGIYLTLKSTNVRVEVNNQIAIVTTTQTFFNHTSQKTPIRFGFPMHKEANAIDLQWLVNGKWHKTIINKTSQSDSIPGGGGGGGGSLDQFLLQYLGDTPLMVSPQDSISPDSSITFKLTYVELLHYEFGIVNFTYPGDYRNIQWDEPVDEQSFYFHLLSDRTIEDLGIENLNAEVDLLPHNATLSWQRFESPASSNFNVYYQLSSTELGLYSMSTRLPDSLLHCDESGGGYLTLLIEPESNAGTEVISKNFSLIIDRSGSMSGNKIVQARNAASYIIDHLNFEDYFNIIDFSDNIKSLYGELMPFSVAHRLEAQDYISKITANGSTNISGALSSSIHQFSVIDTTKANIIIFFTDGQPTAGITNTNGILQEVRNVVEQVETEIYLFTFGIGSDVDKKLLTSLAQENNGLSSFLGSSDLEEKITEFFLKINNPVLINTAYAFEPPVITDVYPSPLPNLYKGQQLILSGRYQEAVPLKLHLSGKAFNLPVQYTFDIPLTDTNDMQRSFLPKVWAKQAIDHHAIEFNLASGTAEQNEIQSLIDSLSVCYGIVSTQFTSYEDGGEVTDVSEIEGEYLGAIVSNYSIRITPNPVTDFCTIHIISRLEKFEPVTILILDAKGQEVMRHDGILQGADTAIQCPWFADLLPGVYYLVFAIGDEMVTKEIIKR